MYERCFLSPPRIDGAEFDVIILSKVSGREDLAVKQNHDLLSAVRSSSVYEAPVSDGAARLFDALRFWFFSFIFTSLPVRAERLA